MSSFNPPREVDVVAITGGASGWECADDQTGEKMRRGKITHSTTDLI